MDAIFFYNAVSKGDLNKIKEFHKKNGKLPLNKNVFYGNHFFPLPLIIALKKSIMNSLNILLTMEQI